MKTGDPIGIISFTPPAAICDTQMHDIKLRVIRGTKMTAVSQAGFTVHGKSYRHSDLGHVVDGTTHGSKVLFFDPTGDVEKHMINRVAAYITSRSKRIIEQLERAQAQHKRLVSGSIKITGEVINAKP